MEDFFAGLEEAEKVEKKAEATKQKVRYWYEEGYVEGNEKESDEESTNGESDRREDVSEREVQEQVGADGNAILAHTLTDRPAVTEEAEADERRCRKAERADCEGDSGEDHYEEVLPQARGGRHVRWGGLGGKLCLTDPEAEEVPALGEMLDELLLPGAEEGIGSSMSSGSTAAASAGGGAQKGEAEASAAAAHSSSAVAEPEPEVRSTAEPTTMQLAIANAVLQKREREEILAKVRRDAIEARTAAAVRNKGQPLPGTRRPLVVSQAWQEKRMQQNSETPAPKPRRGPAMLPGSLSKSQPKASLLQVGGPELRLRGTATGLLVHTGPPLSVSSLERPEPSDGASDDLARSGS